MLLFCKDCHFQSLIQRNAIRVNQTEEQQFRDALRNRPTSAAVVTSSRQTRPRPPLQQRYTGKSQGRKTSKRGMHNIVTTTEEVNDISKNHDDFLIEDSISVSSDDSETERYKEACSRLQTYASTLAALHANYEPLSDAKRLHEWTAPLKVDHLVYVGKKCL
jgi:hypothetical protein